MRFALCLHGAAVVQSSLRLHATDRRAIALARRVGAEIVVLEAVGERGSAPVAVGEALGAGAGRAIRIVEPALGAADAQATGFALGAALHHLEIDLVLFGGDADPEGLSDVPACIAHHMAALYLPGAVDLRSGGSGASGVEIDVRCAGWIRRLHIPLNAVVGIEGGDPPPQAAGTPSSARNPTGVQVLGLADLNIDPALVRRRDDLRGVVEPAPRPLITLQSAAAVGALLRRM